VLESVSSSSSSGTCSTYDGKSSSIFEDLRCIDSNQNKPILFNAYNSHEEKITGNGFPRDLSVHFVDANTVCNGNPVDFRPNSTSRNIVEDVTEAGADQLVHHQINHIAGAMENFAYVSHISIGLGDLGK
jgi:hypothetical protein